MSAVVLTKKEEWCLAYRNYKNKTSEHKDDRLLGIEDPRFKIEKLKTYLKIGSENDARMVDVDLSKYIISLRMCFDDNIFVGSGVIINIIDNVVYILTAAHNIIDRKTEGSKSFKAEYVKCKINEKWYKSSEFYTYSSYNTNGDSIKSKSDLGLIKVVINEDFMFYHVFPKLVSYESNTGYHDCINNNECFIAGYPVEKRGFMFGMNGTYNYKNVNIGNNGEKKYG